MISIFGKIHARTERYILFSRDGDPQSAVWLSIAMVEVRTLPVGGMVTMPADLADQKGLA